jgi:hypothetical protein
MATSGGTQAPYKAAPTQDKADQLVNERLAQRSSDKSLGSNLYL